jgi:hypothetical protein
VMRGESRRREKLSTLHVGVCVDVNYVHVGSCVGDVCMYTHMFMCVCVFVVLLVFHNYLVHHVISQYKCNLASLSPHHHLIITSSVSGMDSL